MKTFVAVIILLFSSSLMAQVTSVNVYEPLAGKAGLTAEYFRDAKAIQEAMGANVAINSDMSGIYRYALTFQNWQGYGEFVQQLGSNEAWRAFQNKISKTPSAIQTDNLQLNLADVTEGGTFGPGSVSQVTVWEVTTGTMAQLMEGGMGAKPIHESAGANVLIYGTGVNTMYYILRFENFSDWGKFRDTPNPAFNQYMQQLNATGDLGAVVIERHTLIGL